MRTRSIRTFAAPVFIAASVSTAGLHAQTVRPPKAQLWMDVSTGGMAGMPDMDALPGMAGALGGLMGRPVGGAGGGGAPTAYGLARTMNVTPPRVLDIAFLNTLRPGAEAAQAIPPGMRMGDSLPLLPPRRTAAAGEREPGDVPPDVERPRGRILVYWGCGEAVRPGQPRVVDLSRAGPSEFAAVFAGRHAADRGARVGPSHVLYPNERNTVVLGRDSSLVGEHQVRGEGVPASMKFTLGDAQNVMPAIQLQSRGTLQQGVVLSWTPLAQARAYYLHAMATNGNDMVIWSSSQTPDTGTGLFDYLPNATIEQWVRERVLLDAGTATCAVPAGIFAPPAGAREQATPMLRMIAYGAESNFAHPPRPADPRATWEPEWAVRVRVKSTTMAMLGQDLGGGATAAPGPAGRSEDRASPSTAAPPPAADSGSSGTIPGLPLPVNPGAILRGIFGR